MITILVVEGPPCKVVRFYNFAKSGFVEIHIDRIKFDYNIGACAAPVVKARVELQNSDGWVDLKTFNNHPHITTCLKPGISAKFSNHMLSSPESKEITFDQTYILEAWVQEVRPQKTYTGR